MDSSAKGIDEFVREIVEVVLGLKRTLYMTNLSAICCLQTREDHIDIGQLPYNGDKPVLAVDTEWTVRDLIQKCFALLGIEVEFCGKGEHEKGVIIDNDISLLNDFEINIDTIKFGQTVVKVRANKDDLPFDSAYQNGFTIRQVWPPNVSIENWLRDLLIVNLNDIRRNDN